MTTTANDIASFLGAALHGKNFEVVGVCTLANPKMGRVLFARNFNQDQISSITEKAPVLVIHNSEITSYPFSNVQIDNPRLAFARIIQKYFVTENVAEISSSAKIGNARIGKGVRIGHHVVIEDGVTVNENTVIDHNVVIHKNVVIGRNCHIKSNTTIGAKGFGFERDEVGVPIAMPHLGGVLIGDDVEIGANNTIVSGTVEPTVIEDYVKTDDHVHVAHNVKIGARTLVTACAEISGGVRIGKDCWIGPNASIINNVEIMDKAFVGIGAVVTKSVPLESMVAGNPAKILRTI